jgi:hypothetical protein
VTVFHLAPFSPLGYSLSTMMFSASRVGATLAQSCRRRVANAGVGAVRYLNVHEYISMDIMQKHGIQTPQCYVASTPQEAEDIFMHKMNQGMCCC